MDTILDMTQNNLSFFSFITDRCQMGQSCFHLFMSENCIGIFLGEMALVTAIMDAISL